MIGGIALTAVALCAVNLSCRLIIVFEREYI